MTRPQGSRTLMIMAGGTGGHIFPALSVAEYAREQGWNVVWLGARTGMEARLVPPKGYTMAWIRFSGVRRRGLLPMALLPLNLLVAFWQSARAIFTHRPGVVLGMGGYVAFPGGMMASFLRRPLVIHEQNSIAGLANRVLSRFADKVLVAFPGAFATRVQAEWTGNPVRAEITAVPAPEARFAGRAGPLRLLVLGGSQGAAALNEIIPKAIALLPAGARPHVTHQSGAGHLDAVRANYERAGVNAEILAFVDDMAARYAAADLLICRAGASTIAELAAAGVPAILIPFPYAVDDHQTQNARFLSGRGGAVLIPQAELTPERLAGLLAQLDREKLLVMARAARDAGKPDATRVVAEACMRLAA
ncbi:MAG TPA: undecaprenyldiphospho-muramoylpentapeptide beta-N-acetylglucosaminyltransferase [Burkholderiales bacterium]|nr:undecaprenyldiphospho-muramoylpentapeptide beta-N-acetylglucosaminyltransferase [Burkholderiales bacterium]